MYPVYNSSHKIHLIGSKALGLLLEQWGILVDNILICRIKIMFSMAGPCRGVFFSIGEK